MGVLLELFFIVFCGCCLLVLCTVVISSFMFVFVNREYSDLYKFRISKNYMVLILTNRRSTIVVRSPVECFDVIYL